MKVSLVGFHGVHERKQFMKIKVSSFVSLAVMISCLTNTTVQGFCQDAAAPVAESSPAATDNLAGAVCPRFIWMANGGVYSYYAQTSPACLPVNFNSTSSTLSTLTPCQTGGAGCITTLTRNGMLDAAFSDVDPGMKGYGADLAGENGRKSGRLIPTNGKRPWLFESGQRKVRPVDDCDLDFKLPDGTPVQAQIFVVIAEDAGVPYLPAMLGRGNEIQRFNNPRAPHDGKAGEVKPIDGRPHAFEFEYTPNQDGAPSVKIEIITHHSTPGHGK